MLAYMLKGADGSLKCFEKMFNMQHFIHLNALTYLHKYLHKLSVCACQFLRQLNGILLPYHGVF